MNSNSIPENNVVPPTTSNIDHSQNQDKEANRKHNVEDPSCNSEENELKQKMLQTIENEIICTPFDIELESRMYPERMILSLRDAIVMPVLYPQIFSQGRISWNPNFLCYGPCGMRKEFLVKATAFQGKLTVFDISIQDVISKWGKESQVFIRLIFDMAIYRSPSVILIKQAEVLGGEEARSPEEAEIYKALDAELFRQLRVLFQRKHEEKQYEFVIAVGTVENPWKLTTSLRHFLERGCYVELPKEEERKIIIQEHIKECSGEVDMKYLIRQTNGYSIDEIVAVCNDAIRRSRRRNRLQFRGLDQAQNTKDRNLLSQRDFIEALRTIRRSVSDEDLSDYQRWRAMS